MVVGMRLMMRFTRPVVEIPIFELQIQQTEEQQGSDDVNVLEGPALTRGKQSNWGQ